MLNTFTVPSNPEISSGLSGLCGFIFVHVFLSDLGKLRSPISLFTQVLATSISSLF